MSDNGVIKTLRNVAILVTVIVLILMAVFYTLEASDILESLLDDYAKLLGLVIFVSLPFYILLFFAKFRLKSDQRAGIRTAYLRACVAGLGVTFLVVAYAVYVLALSLAGHCEIDIWFGFPCIEWFLASFIFFTSPLISGVVMSAVFSSALLSRQKASNEEPVQEKSGTPPEPSEKDGARPKGKSGLYWGIPAALLVLIWGGTLYLNKNGYEYNDYEYDVPTWEKTFGGPLEDGAVTIVALADGGFAIAGLKTVRRPGGDAWIFRLDQAGELVWETSPGGSWWDEADSVVALADGGFAVAGWIRPEGTLDDDDAWVLRLDKTGQILWERTFGGSEWDQAYSIVALADGGFVVAGRTESRGAGQYDAWVLRLDSNGGLLWDKTFGGAGNDSASSIVALADGGFVVAGGTESKGGGQDDADRA